MQRKENTLSIFLFFFLLSLILFFFSKNTLFSKIDTVGNVLFPIESLFYHIATAPFSWNQNRTLMQLQQENIYLKSELAKDEILHNDDIALRDQFKTTNPASVTLLPATIIGMPSFIPGITDPETIVLDKGSQDGIRKGAVVIYKDNLLGQVDTVSEHAALVVLVSNPKTSFTANSLMTNALGIVHGSGNGGIVLDNVILSDTLKKGDSIVTHGDENLQQKGLPPGLIVGRIISIEKNPSNLFQKANIQNIVDIRKLHIVFIIRV